MREIGFAIVVVVIALVGITIEVAGEPVAPGGPRATGDLFHERSIFCAPVPGVRTNEGADIVADATAHQAIAGATADEGVLLGRDDSPEPPEQVAGNILDLALDKPVPAVFTGYGDPVYGATATSFRGPESGLAGAMCARAASDRWYFPFGSSARGFNEWILLYNPFPDEAVIKVTLVTAGGTRSPAGLSDVAVPAHSGTGVRLNDFQLQQKGLAVEVAAVRGRVVSWHTIYAQPEGRPAGVGMSLGAPRAAVDWYFPAGAVGSAQDERIAILNPSVDEALVTVSLITDDEAIQPPDLVEMEIPGRSSREINLGKEVGGEKLGGASIAVRSVNEVPIVAEQAIWYSEDDFRGFSAEIGAASGAQNWWVGPAAAKPERDGLLMINTGESEATVDVTLLMLEGTPLTPAELSGLTIPPGGRLRVGLEDLTGRGLAVALVESSSDIAVERIAYSRTSNDVATVMGIPLD
jgi:hypothetical protein